ncbi:molybdopterin-dependent oxidoreductase [Vibrio campbellii]|uniref:Trimethylamine-N-oxide reductase n=1 Tax=Vibrio campbellii (strain ATCC BAA-1116) TaxID=2902295 RepID=A7N3R4_VIBC1|nr:molybdopterin-dependent oxidoreductase [Vibrio campbellii]ABU73357.1 hypothetical protein VIBHAR_05452 [Vibrio campbellii ATCC BAA-1116]AGU98720.1 trimethylamine-N-oxide reductase [Vibrio campbellii ATCC BAA-1116]MBT0123205.1 molybdopterin-dependent oxidoreductase [Vibrio campbellii]MBT0138239.1 molybdopterin-dependent oxidoreductase [Vibrio campbellii]MBT0142947.1 molybdopterin-dependent oxidoreductase [Vibrio campbellii]
MELSRRSFLKSAGVASTAALSAQLTPLAFAASTDVAIKKALTASKFGTFEATIDNGVITGVSPIDKLGMTIDLAEYAYKTINNPSRIQTPMVRKGYLEGKGGNRGDNEFVPISWEQAIDLLYNKLEEAQVNHGPSSIYPHSSWGPFGQYGNCATVMKRALNLHGKTLSSSGYYSTAAAQSILPEVVGDSEVYSEQTTLSYIEEETDLLIFWACDPIKNLKIGFGTSDHAPYEYWDRIKAKVASGKLKVISVDPVKSEAQKFLGGEQLAIKPQTDTALLLGLCHELLESDQYDADFIDTYTDGADELFSYLNGEKDGVKKTAEWASKICGVPVETIKSLAKQMVSGRTLISSGWSAQRAHHGEQYCMSIVSLASMIGQIGLPGGGFSFGYIYNDAGAGSSNGARLGSLSASIKGAKPKHDKPYTSTPYFPTSRIVDVIENPGMKSTYKGNDITYPDLRVLIVSGANIVSTHQDVNRLTKALDKLDFMVTIDTQWTATCRYSDLVLPTTTLWERDELSGYGNATNRGVVGMRKLIEPMYDSKDDFDIWRMFTAKFGKEKEFTGGKTQLQWLKEFYDKAYEANQKKGIEMPTFESFWTDKTAFIRYEGNNKYVRHQSFRDDPDLDGLATDSGLIQLFSQKVANANLKDCTPYASWIEPTDWKERVSGEYMHMVTLHPSNRLHSQLGGVQELREAVNSNDHEPMWINPSDGAKYGIKTGDIVEGYNERGSVLFGAIISDKVSEGVVASQEGGWYSPKGASCLYGNANVLTNDQGTSSWGQGPTAQTCLVKVKKYSGKKPQIDCFTGPIIKSS